MVNLLQAWAERYAQVRPDVSVQVAGGGSGVGIAGLIDGTVDIAAASREMKPSERQQATARASGAPSEDGSASARAFADWVLSPAGQEVVRQLGFVPVRPAKFSQELERR
jgi:ABC-type phosphate transport system substrate-binding protein